MGLNSAFSNLDKVISKDFLENYSGNTDIGAVLDTAHLVDNPDGLLEEMARQPAVYAYWANLKRVADATYTEITERFERAKVRKLKIVMQVLKSNSISHPSSKIIDAQFHDIYKDEEWYKKFHSSISIWKKRKEELDIIERALLSRENIFRSMCYLMSNMMNKDIAVYGKKKP